MEIRDLIRRDMRLIVVLEPINHPVNPLEIARIRTPCDALTHAMAILSDAQEMLGHDYPKDQINAEINEAKYFISKVIEYLQLNPLCPLNTICPYYDRIKEIARRLR